MEDIRKIIEQNWEGKDNLFLSAIQDDHKLQLIDALNTVLHNLDQGNLRVCQKDNGAWIVHEWIKKAILLFFKMSKSEVFYGWNKLDESDISQAGAWFDKVPLKTHFWSVNEFEKAGFRCVPGAVIRKSAFIAKNCVIMPSFINVGAYVDEGTMIDTWATVGSCAQIGKNCHISGGAGIGGVLEPLQAKPVIIEDNCFIGARSEIAEGVIVGKGSVISMGVFIGASTKIIDRASGQISYGYIPPYSVVVSGSAPSKDYPDVHLNCAVIVKQVDEKTRSKTSINELLRC